MRTRRRRRGTADLSGLEVARPGDVVLVAFPYADSRSYKWRPALVVGNWTSRGTVVAKITSRNDRSSPYLVPLLEWRKAGLRQPSWVATDCLCTAVPVRKVGTVCEKTVEMVQAKIFSLLTRSLPDLKLGFPQEGKTA